MKFNRRQKRQSDLDQYCFVRSCDQAITGRNLQYTQALEIVENEEYLSAADQDFIRRKRLKRELLSNKGNNLLLPNWAKEIQR